jgi:DNA-binding MarR family transcriptional regulator
MTTDQPSACLQVLAEIGALGPVRRQLLKVAGPELHAGAAAVVWHLSRHGPLRLSDLAAALHLDISAVSRQVSELEASGYVEKRREPGDRRSCVAHLTDSGHAVVEDAVSRLTGRFSPLFARWSADELLVLAEGLRRARRDLLPDGPRTASRPADAPS